MAIRDIVGDLTNLLHPMPPALEPNASEDERDGHWAWCDQVDQERRHYEQNLRISCDEQDVEPLLAEIAEARADMIAAEKRMRLLLAYAREFVAPRPYKLDDLAQAAGMSISGVRTAYDDDEIADVANLTGGKPRNRHPRQSPTSGETNPDSEQPLGGPEQAAEARIKMTRLREERS